MPPNKTSLEKFFFQRYIVNYQKNWMEIFKQKMGRAYDPDKDSQLFYEDMVAEYLDITSNTN